MELDGLPIQGREHERTYFFRSQKTINSPSNRIARYKTTNHQLIIFDQSVI